MLINEPLESDSVNRLLRLITDSLDSDKAEDIVSIDLQGKTTVADHMVIANGQSRRQVLSMAEHLAQRLKDEGLGTVHMEGQSQGDWVLLDAGDVIVHLFRPEVRAFYNLEKMWSVTLPNEQAAV